MACTQSYGFGLSQAIATNIRTYLNFIDQNNYCFLDCGSFALTKTYLYNKIISLKNVSIKNIFLKIPSKNLRVSLICVAGFLRSRKCHVVNEFRRGIF